MYQKWSIVSPHIFKVKMVFEKQVSDQLASCIRNGPPPAFSKEEVFVSISLSKMDIKSTKTNWGKSAHSLLDTDFWLLRTFSTVFQGSKIQGDLRREFKSGSYIHWDSCWDTHTYNLIFFSVYVKGPAKTPDHQNKLFCTLQCTEQEGKTLF